MSGSVSQGRLAGKVAIVTGAAKGQGEGVARTFAAEGARVALFDILDDPGKRVAESIAGAGGEALFVHCDVSQVDEVSDAVELAASHCGGLDILYNNAAVIRYGR